MACAMGIDFGMCGARVLAWSLLGLRGGSGANGDTPETHDVMSAVTVWESQTDGSCVS